MKFEYMHHIINEDGNRVEWWAVNDCDMIVLPYEGNNIPDFANARVSRNDSKFYSVFEDCIIIGRLEEHMIEQLKQQQYEQQI